MLDIFKTGRLESKAGSQQGKNVAVGRNFAMHHMRLMCLLCNISDEAAENVEPRKVEMVSTFCRIPLK